MICTTQAGPLFLVVQYKLKAKRRSQNGAWRTAAAIIINDEVLNGKLDSTDPLVPTNPFVQRPSECEKNSYFLID